MEKVEITSIPHRSRVRFLGDWTECVTASAGQNSIFRSAVSTKVCEDLHAFDYVIGKDAASAGYGKNTRATKKHTTLTTARRIPAGAGTIHAIALMFSGFLLKPVKGFVDAANNVAGDYDDAVDDNDKKQITTLDAFQDGVLAETAMRQICECYQPYINIDGTDYDLPDMRLLSPGGGQLHSGVKGAAIQGPVLYMPEGMHISDKNEFYVGFRLERDMGNHVDDPTDSGSPEDPATMIRAALGYPAGAEPTTDTSGSILWNMDLDVVLFGQFERIKGS